MFFKRIMTKSNL